MRNFDNWNRYLDNSGKTLSGCVQFMVKDGTTSAPIFDSDSVALENPQITDIYGRTEHQVFVDSDVLAYFYKYIGQGTIAEEVEEGIDTSDESKWSLQYTAESINDLIAHVSTDSTVAIGTMSDLRALNPNLVAEIEGLKVVQLLGYNEIGDKEAVLYVWNPESEVQDDGGAIIKADDLLTGRWIMVKPTEHCDCRHFGIFPTNSSASGTDYSTEIGNLFSYCNTARIRPYFSATGDYRFYFYSNLSATSNDFIDVAKGVVFEDTSNSSFNCPGFNGDPYFDNALTALINCKTVKTSWNPRTIITYEKVILDADIRERVPAFTNAEIDVQYSPCVGYTFTNCKLSETKALGTAGEITNSYNNCVLTERMFITSGDQKAELAGHVTNCQFDIDDWKNNIDMWKAMRCTDDANCAFDYRNFANVGSPWGIYSGNKLTGNTLTVTNLINPSSTQYSVPRISASRIIFDNCEGSYQIEAGVIVEIRNCRSIFISVNGSDVNIKSSSVSINTAGSGSSISAYDSTVSFSSNKTLVNFNTKNSTIVASNDSTTVTCQNFSLYSGILMCPIQCNICVVKDSQINKPIISNEYKANESDEFWTINCFIDNCIFNDRHLVNPSNSPVKVLGTWTNNIGNIDNPLAINNTNMYDSDSDHSYTYHGNSGTFIADEPILQHSLYLGNASEVMLNDNTAVVTSMGSSGYQTLNVCFRISANSAQTNKNITGVQFFRIGKDAFNVNVYSAVEMAFANGVLRQDWRYNIMPMQYQMQLNYNGTANNWYATMIPVPIVIEMLSYDVSIARWTGAVPDTSSVSYSYLMRSKFSKM